MTLLEISVSGRFPYCPLEQILIAENFNITDSDDTGISQFSIQISSGYASGSDVLSLTGNHPTINASWDITEGKLTLNPGFNHRNFIYRPDTRSPFCRL